MFYNTTQQNRLSLWSAGVLWRFAAVSPQILETVHKMIMSLGPLGSSQVAARLTWHIFSRSRDQAFFKQHHQTANALYRETRQRRVPDDADNAASFKRKIVSWRSCLNESVSFTVVSGSLGRLGYALICSNLLLSFSTVLSRSCCCCCLSSAVLRLTFTTIIYKLVFLQLGLPFNFSLVFGRFTSTQRKNP